MQPYSGATAAPATGTQQQIFQLVQQLLSGQGPMQGQGEDVLKGLMAPYSDTQAKDYWNQAVKAPMLESWNEDIKPQVMEQFAAYDAAGSGPAAKALTESGKNLETSMGTILGDVLQKYQNNYLNRQQSAAGTALSYPETLVSSALPAGAQEYGIDQALLQDPYQKWLMSQPWANPWLSQLNLALGTKAFENVGYGGGQQPGIFGQLLGAGAQLGSAYLKGPTNMTNIYSLFG